MRPQTTMGEAPYPSGTLTISGTNTQTTLTIPLSASSLAVSNLVGSPGTPIGILDAKAAIIVIANTATSQTITGATLTFSDTVAEQSVSIAYPLSSVSIASNSTGNFTVSFSNGVLKNVALTVTFGSAPTTGSVGAQIVLQGSSTASVSGTVNAAQSGTWNINDQHSNVTADYDTGAGTQNLTMFGMALPASGGAVAGGTSSNPLRIDPTGATAQPISGTVNVGNFPGTQAISGSVTANAGTNLNTSALALETGGNLAAAKADLDTLAGIVSSNKAAVKSATNDIVDLATLLARLTDTFGSSTNITAGTTFGTIPLVSTLSANSYVTLPNASYQDTFIVEINVASAFVGTIAFYGLEPDGSTLQLINAHQRNSSTNGNSTAINTGSALNQVWEGSIAGFKAIYAVCTAFTSGSISITLGLSAANYAHAIINTVASNITQLNGTTPQLDGSSSNRLGVSLYGKNSTAGDTALGLDASGRITSIIQAVAGTALAADQSNTELRVSNYVKTTTAGDTALTLGQATKANSLPVTLASDSTEPINTGTPTETAVSVGVSNTSVLAANANRKFLSLVNDSNNTIYVTFSGTNAALNTGTRLNANGGAILFDRYVPTAAVKAIATATSSNLLVTEG